MSELGSPDRNDDPAPIYQTPMLDDDQFHSTAPLLPKSQEHETAPADGMKELEMGDVKSLSPSPSPSPRPSSTLGIDDEWTPSPRFKRTHSRSRTFRRTCLLFLLKAVLAVWFGVVLYNVVRYCARVSQSLRARIQPLQRHRQLTMTAAVVQIPRWASRKQRQHRRQHRRRGYPRRQKPENNNRLHLREYTRRVPPLRLIVPYNNDG